MNKLRFYIEIMRPPQLVKSSLIVILGQFCASNNQLNFNSYACFILFAMIIIWAGLYVVNDVTDKVFDSGSFYKKHRPLAAGLVQEKIIIFISISFIFIGLGCVILSSYDLGCLATLMVINHFTYTFEPLRLKRRFVWDVISAGILSQSFRFLIGYCSITYSINLEVTFGYLGIVFWKIFTYLIYRSQDPHESVCLNTNTVNYLGIPLARKVSYIFLILSMLCFLLYIVKTKIFFEKELIVFSIIFVVIIIVIMTVIKMQCGKIPQVLHYIIFSTNNRDLEKF